VSRIGKFFGTSRHGDISGGSFRLLTFIEVPIEKLVRTLQENPSSRNSNDRSFPPLNRSLKELDFDRYVDFYYENFRKEVDRENDLTLKRLNSVLSFQAFLLLTVTGLITIIVPEFGGMSCLMRSISLLPSTFLSFLATVISLYGFKGIESSRKSLTFAKDQWVAFNRINGMAYPRRLPQPTKRANDHSFDLLSSNGHTLSKEELMKGDFYKLKKDLEKIQRDSGYDLALAIPGVMFVFWLLTSLICTIIIVVFLILNLVGTCVEATPNAPLTGLLWQA